MTPLVGKSRLTRGLLQAMSNETAGASSGWHASQGAAKDGPFDGNELVFLLEAAFHAGLLMIIATVLIVATSPSHLPPYLI